MKININNELKSFEGLWKGGFRGGFSWESRSDEFTNYQAIYEKTIKPYISKDQTCLEIGCGNGFWSEKLVEFGSYIAFDALSAEHNNFWNRIKARDSIKYFQVEDFECKQIKDDSVDYVFSYDVFCHISYSGARAYLKNLYPKLKKGAKCFIMIADKDKYKHKDGLKKLMITAGHDNLDSFFEDYDGSSEKNPGRWFFYNKDRFINLLKEFDYKLIDDDVALESCKRNPILFFEK